MFPPNESYIFTGCNRNVVCSKKKSLKSLLYAKGNDIYLGKILRMEPILWTQNRTILDGFAVFEYGCVSFPDYKHIKINNYKSIDFHCLKEINIYDVVYRPNLGIS